MNLPSVVFSAGISMSFLSATISAEAVRNHEFKSYYPNQDIKKLHIKWQQLYYSNQGIRKKDIKFLNIQGRSDSGNTERNREGIVR